MNDRIKRATNLNQIWFIAILVLLVGYRFLHFGSTIDNPHQWRQCDTACYALNFYRQGINLLKPSVCWLGDYQTLVLEFPLPEAISAIGYHLFGPTIVVDRFVTLLFFLGSAYYLYMIVTTQYGKRSAKITTLIYMSLPLSLYYSRAVHIDFSAVFFAHGMFYHWLRGYEEDHAGSMMLGGLMGVFAFLIKAPYAFYLYLPLGYFMLKQPKPKIFMKWLPIFIIPMVFLGLWRIHAEIVNGAAPDWFFLPGYKKMTHLGLWYFGTMGQRLDPKNWLVLGKRFLTEVMGPAGLVLFVLGLFLRPPRRKSPRLMWLWMIATFAATFTFFNLNVIHNYYQIPYLAVVSFFIASPLEWILSIHRVQRPALQKWGFLFAIGVLIAGSVWTAESQYFSVDHLRVSAGRIIQQHTEQDSLVIASMEGGTSWCDPTLLCMAQRNGWPQAMENLDGKIVNQLRSNGAEILSIILHTEVPADLAVFLEDYPSRDFPLNVGDWHLKLYRFDKKAP